MRPPLSCSLEDSMLAPEKPDGDPGWASYFLSKVHPVYLVDPCSVGRSAPITPVDLMPTPSTQLTELAFTAPELSNKYYQAKFHTQWPGVGTFAAELELKLTSP